jgi:hypothetical protein
MPSSPSRNHLRSGPRPLSPAHEDGGHIEVEALDQKARFLDLEQQIATGNSRALSTPRFSAFKVWPRLLLGFLHRPPTRPEGLEGLNGAKICKFPIL